MVVQFLAADQMPQHDVAGLAGDPKVIFHQWPIPLM
jgi:hypothetical protein